MKITRRELSLLIERFLIEQDELEELEPLGDEGGEEGGEELEELEPLDDEGGEEVESRID